MEPRVLDDPAVFTRMDTLAFGEDLSLPRKSLIPGRGFFVSDELSPDERAAEVKAELDDHDIAAIVDADADGLGCAAILKEAHGDLALFPSNPHDFTETLAFIAEHAPADLTLYLCDLAPDSFESVADSLESLVASGTTVRWFDHHQWETDVLGDVRETGVDVTLGDSAEECTADVAVRALDGAIPAHLVELAVVTRDHDLWIKEDPRSDDIADYAYWEDPDAYVSVVSEHGPALPDSVMEFLATHREEKSALIDLAVDRAEFVEVGEWRVGVTYGRCSQNEVADALRVAGADAAVILKPAGSASIRGSDSFERCHEVAAQVNGGGHPKAAGCKPSIYTDMLDYAHHWVTQGAVAKREILRAFEELSETAD